MKKGKIYKHLCSERTLEHREVRILWKSAEYSHLARRHSVLSAIIHTFGQPWSTADIAGIYCATAFATIASFDDYTFFLYSVARHTLVRVIRARNTIPLPSAAGFCLRNFEEIICFYGVRKQNEQISADLSRCIKCEMTTAEATMENPRQGYPFVINEML